MYTLINRQELMSTVKPLIQLTDSYMHCTYKSNVTLRLFFSLCKTLHSLGTMTDKRGSLLLHTRASLVNITAELHSCITKSYMSFEYMFCFCKHYRRLYSVHAVWVTIIFRCGQSVYCGTSYTIFLLVQNQSRTGSIQSQCNQYTVSNNHSYIYII